jgi:hypothetical protein
MSWTTPKTWTPDEVVTATDMNIHVRDNLNALKTPPGSQVVRNNGTAYSTTSTSFVPVDSTNLKVTLTTAGGAVMVGFQGTAHADSATSRHMSFDVRIDGTTNWAESQGYAGGIVTTAIQSTVAQGVSFGPVFIHGLPAGQHTFELMWRMNGGTGYLHSDTNDAEYRNEEPVIFWAREIG